MKLTTTAAIAAVSLATVASADVFSADYDMTVDSGSLVAEVISLPGLASIDSIAMELATTWGGDFEITLTSPTGDVFELMFDDVAINDGSGNFDMGLVAGSGLLDNVDTYTFVETGGLADFDDTDGLAAGGTYDANAWASGGWAAGDWTLSIADDAGGDSSSVGNVSIMYTVPAPGALALLGLAGLAGRRRRNG